MAGLITAPLGDVGTSEMDLDAIPSTFSERGDPLGTLRQIGSATSRSIAEFGFGDEFGRQISGPEPMVDPATLQQKWGIKSSTPGNGLTFDSPLPESVAREMNQAKRDEIARKDAAARSPAGVGSALADFGYGMLDPVGIAASVLPVFGEARIGSALGRLGIDLGDSLAGRTALRAATGAVDATAANVPLVGLRYGLSQQQQADYTMSDAARDLAYGSVLGGVLHPALGALGDLLGRRPRAPTDDASREGVGPMPEGPPAFGDEPEQDVADPLVGAATTQPSVPVDHSSRAIAEADWFRLTEDTEALRHEIASIPDAPPDDPQTVARRAEIDREAADPSTTSARRADLQHERNMLTEGAPGEDAGELQLFAARSAAQRAGLEAAYRRAMEQSREIEATVYADPAMKAMDENPVVRAAAMQASVGAVAEDRPVDIAPIVKGNPPNPEVLRRAQGGAAPEDEATLHQADRAATVVAKPDALPPEISRAIQAAQADLDRARVAGVLRPEDETELIAANEADQASASRQQGLLQAGACVARGLG